MTDLSDLEDLYYATCAKLKERMDDINIRLSNGFIHPKNNYFSYNSKGLGVTEPVTAGEWKATLTAHAKFLYDPLVEAIMGRAIFLMHKRAQEAKTQRLPLNGKFPGLRDMRNMSSGMIFGSLAEKYRIVVHREEQEKARAAQAAQLRRERLPTRVQHLLAKEEVGDRASNATIPAMHSHQDNKVPAAQVKGLGNSTVAKDASEDELLPAQKYDETANPPQRYISPYNLEERAKKLNQPNGPEMPCICDPECICAPLCAAEPTENCFCEEHGLFCRVTEGMDIDELSYPRKEVEEAEAERAGNEFRTHIMAMDNAQQQHILENSSSTDDDISSVNDYPEVDDRSEVDQCSNVGQDTDMGAYSTFEPYSTLETLESTFEPYSTLEPLDSTFEPYSTLEPLENLEASGDSMEVDQQTQPDFPRLRNGQIDYAALYREKFCNGSLSLYSKEGPDGMWRRDESCHWHDEMRAATSRDADFDYPGGDGYGRLNMKRIYAQTPTRGERLLGIASNSLRGRKTPPKMLNSANAPINKVLAGPVVKQEKPKTKTSLFANRFLGRSNPTTSTSPQSQTVKPGQHNVNAINTSKALPRLPK